MTEPIYCVMPILAHPEYTRAAIADVLAQSVPTRLLLINQGVEDPFREELEQTAEEYDHWVLLWSHQPPLPSLAATWNTALDFVWTCGGEVALVVNNDVRLNSGTVEYLSKVLHRTEALFVSAVGVTGEQFDPTVLFDVGSWLSSEENAPDQLVEYPRSPGGPDFSCFLISRACHEQFRFDDHFMPAFCEDLDYHRTLLLAGEGARIFSVNLPYLHYGSATLKTVKDRSVIDRAIEAGSRTYYKQKWGGPVNQETFLKPFGGGFSEPAKVEDGTATTPYLQAHQANQLDVPTSEVPDGQAS